MEQFMSEEEDTSGIYDVLVIGGGPSGVSCAYTLLEQYYQNKKINVQSAPPLKVGLVEARNRLGGRTYTVDVDLPSDTKDEPSEQKDRKRTAKIDLGGQWIGIQHATARLFAKKLGLQLVEQYETGKKVLDMWNKYSTYTSDIPLGVSIFGLIEMQTLIWRLEWMSKNIDIPKYAEDYDAQSGESWLRANSWTSGSRALFTVAIRLVFGCEPAEISLLWILRYFKFGGGVDNVLKTKNGNQHFVVEGGSMQFSTLLAIEFEKLGGDLILDCAAVEVRSWENEEVEVVCVDGRVFATRRVVIAMPPSIANKLRYDPPLPGPRRALMARTYMGKIIKSVTIYSRAFWREKDFSGEMVGDGADGPIINAFDHSAFVSDGTKVPAIVGFINADPAYKWSLHSESERKQATIEQYAKWFGKEALDPVLYIEKDWSDEKFSDGCPVCNFPTGALWLTSHILTTPCGRIYWAGTEISRSHPGFIEGAFSSGIDAANSILQILSKAETQPEALAEFNNSNSTKQRHGKSSWSPNYSGLSIVRIHIIVVFLAILMGALLQFKNN